MQSLNILFLCIIFFCSGCEDDVSSSTVSVDPIRTDSTISVLFVGNSLTYSNDLPGLVESVAKEKDITVETKMIARGNYAIIDHWNDGTIQEELVKGIYDFVVVQQGPSSQAYGREVLIEYGKLISDLGIEYNTKLAYFMVWPSRTYYYTFDGVIKNHRDAAALNDALLLPVGEVWKAHFDSTEQFDYYSKDGFHPSFLGSQIAAEVIVEHLFNSESTSNY